MNANAKKRKEKRWAIMIKPCSSMGTNTRFIPTLEQTTWTFTDTSDILSVGSSILRLRGNFVSKVRLNVPYNLYGPVATVPAEQVTIIAVGYEQVSLSTVLTFKVPVIGNYGVGSKLVGGALNTTLVDDVMSGETTLNLLDTLGLQVNTYLCIAPGDTNIAEQIYVTGIEGTVVTLKDPLYFDHPALTPIKEVDTLSPRFGADNYYNLVFNTIYGKSPVGNDYIRISFGTDTPWVQIDEKTSFQEAKNVASDQGAIWGLENVRVFRVVDIYDVLYPIS